MAEKRFVNKKIGSRPIFCKPDCNHLEFIHFIALYILISIERVAFRFAIKVDFDLYDKIEYILDIFETFADIIYIDTSNGNNLSSKVILDEADLVVVNLAQNNSMIQNFFDNYSSILHKCVFIISSYRKKAKLTINKISKTHLIDKSNIAMIPYNVEYHEAVSHGNIVEFLMRNFSCKRSHPNYTFIKEVKKAVEMIMRNMELNHKEEYL